MPTLLDKPCQQELRLTLLLRNAVEQEIECCGWTREYIANKLGIAPLGVRVLMLQTWSVETAIRIASALGILESNSKMSGNTGQPK